MATDISAAHLRAGPGPAPSGRLRAATRYRRAAPRWGHLILVLFAALPALLLSLPVAAAEGEAEGSGRAIVLGIDGPIGAGISGYLVRGIQQAGDRGADLVIITMDTPGGLDGAMRDIIQAILASEVPVATFVAPQGARAASAGTYILYASHIAAMAPATNTGSATPVSLGGGDSAPRSPFGAPEEQDEDGDSADDDEDGASKDDGNRTPAPATAMERKVLNDSIAYIRGLAELRGRNVEWAEAAVREAANLTASDALAANVIDFVAEDIPDLLAQIDGLSVELERGDVVLDTDGMIIEQVAPDWRTNLLETITRPEVAYLLLLVGIYGLLFEGYNPGALVPGVIGAICLLIAAYALQVLPVNYAGLGLIALGVALMIAEAFAPSFGILGLGGLAAFVFGSVMLMGTGVPGFRAPLGFITGAAVTGGGLTLFLGWMVMRARASPTVSGREHMLHAVAVAEKDFASDGAGTVRIQGELWAAHAAAADAAAIRAGDTLEVVAINGLRLEVAPPTRT